MWPHRAIPIRKLTMRASPSADLSQDSPVFPMSFYGTKGFGPQWQVVFIFPHLLSILHSGTLPQFFLDFMALTLLKIKGQLLCELLFNFDLSDVALKLDSGFAVWVEVLQRRYLPFLVHSLRWNTLSTVSTRCVWLLDFVVSARFFHYKITLFPSLLLMFWANVETK